MLPEFIYFDMGNVLLHFSHEREAEQIARVAGLKPAAVWKLLFEDGLHWQAERGELRPQAFYDRFCELTGTRPDYRAFLDAGNDIFSLNAAIVTVVESLRAAGARLGVLSNTSEAHWEHCTRRFPIMTACFPVHALSFRIGVMKPDPRVYSAAAELAGAACEKILFIDDRPDNVLAARAAGWQAVVFESAGQLAEELARRDLIPPL